jgi:RNA polymerase primary sigma factor/RNA polymerase nonessential primary-like sigma factor
MCYTWRFELLDLIQEGNLGLMEAIERHEVSTGHPLSALAGRCISSALSRAIWERDGLMRLKGTVPREVGRMEKVTHRLTLQLGREPSRAEVAREMQMDEHRVDKLLEWQRHYRAESLERLLLQEGAEERLGSVNLFGVQSAEDAGEWIGLQEVVCRVMQAALSPGQRRVLWLRLGLDQEGESRKPGEVAQLLGKPLASVHAVETQAKKRLRDALALRGFGPEGEEVA